MGLSLFLINQIVIISRGTMLNSVPESSVSQTSMFTRSPSSIASNGEIVVVGDRGGSLLFWQWPQLPGHMIKAHQDGGHVIAVGKNFATSGDWDPIVKQWDSSTQQARFSVKLFDARVSALCATNHHLLVAGANHLVDSNTALLKDIVSLQPSQLFWLDENGKSVPVSVNNSGQVEALACGENWIVAVDSDSPNLLRWVHANQISTIQIYQGPATALISYGNHALVADQAGIWMIDPQQGTREVFATFEADTLRVLFLVAIGDRVFSGTSEGIFQWPSGTRFSHHTKQPVAMTRHGDSLLVLWETGIVEQLDPKTGAVMTTVRLPIL
jgi:hypothetical protein